MNDLSGLLIKHRIVHEQAIHDPEGFDGGRTLDAVNCVQTIITERERNYRAEIERLEAERDRLRAALDGVVNNPTCGDPDCCDRARKHSAAIKFAIAALAGKDCA